MAELSEEKKAKIREMRLKGATIALIQAEVGVKFSTIQKCCEDMNINHRSKNPLKAEVQSVKNTFPVKKFSFDELSEEDKKRYNNCKPPVKGEDKEAYIIGTKGAYYRANIFEASRRGHPYRQELDI